MSRFIPLPQNWLPDPLSPSCGSCVFRRLSPSCLWLSGLPPPLLLATFQHLLMLRSVSCSAFPCFGGVSHFHSTLPHGSLAFWRLVLLPQGMWSSSGERGQAPRFSYLSSSLLSGDGRTGYYDWSGPQIINPDTPLRVFLKLNVTI